jgi:hypothetical protein
MLNQCEKLFPLEERGTVARLAEKPSFFGFLHHMEKQMTNVTFFSAALIAAAVFTTQAMAANNDVAARRATTTTRATATDCVRAPAVGAYASDPYIVPPCASNAGF